MRKLLIVGAEALPFASTGGLGDVMGSLPGALAKTGEDWDVRAVLPLYGSISQEYRDKMKKVAEFTVALAWRQQYCGVYAYKSGRVTYYFIDNEYYFKRGSLYGQYDDGERYAFFCHAVLDMMPHLGFYPDVLHANDWQAALCVIYLRNKYTGDEYRNIKTVYTIHNIEYQGQYDFAILGDVFDLPTSAHDTVAFDGCINLMKGAIVSCDRLTTVSRRYAEELRSPYFSGRLAAIINQYADKTTGIVNGIDTVYYNPKKDPAIKVPYSVGRRAGKAEDKADLQRLFGLPESPTTPVIAMVSRLASHKGFDLVTRVLEEVLQWDVQFVLLGTGEKELEEFFADLSRRYPSKIGVVLSYNKALSKQIYAGADIFLMPSKSEPCGLSQMIASVYGTVPVVREVGGLFDTIKPFDPTTGKGNGMTFVSYNAHDMMDGLRRAVTLYYDDPKKWSVLVGNAMKMDFSWNASALGYLDLYDTISSQRK